jgi:NTE family protein
MDGEPVGRVALALQGGGAHGAFTWGVLDRLLEQGFVPDAICGVSSGAIIGTMLAQGLVRGGCTGARDEIRKFWRTMAQAQPALRRPDIDHILRAAAALSNHSRFDALAIAGTA